MEIIKLHFPFVITLTFLLSLNKIEGGSAMTNHKTSFSICHCTHLSLSLPLIELLTIKTTNHDRNNKIAERFSCGKMDRTSSIGFRHVLFLYLYGHSISHQGFDAINKRLGLNSIWHNARF